MSKKLGGLGLNGIKLKWTIGTHDNLNKVEGTPILKLAMVKR